MVVQEKAVDERSFYVYRDSLNAMKVYLVNLGTLVRSVTTMDQLQILLGSGYQLYGLDLMQQGYCPCFNNLTTKREAVWRYKNLTVTSALEGYLLVQFAGVGKWMVGSGRYGVAIESHVVFNMPINWNCGLRLGYVYKEQGYYVFGFFVTTELGNDICLKVKANPKTKNFSYNCMDILGQYRGWKSDIRGIWWNYG